MRARALFKQEELKGLLALNMASKPADIKPLRLEVDEAAWQQPQNMGRARVQSQLKSVEARKQVESLIDVSVLRSTQAPFRSQVHFVSRPHSEDMRFCIDYRALN